jgi:hypothetical protein
MRLVVEAWDPSYGSAVDAEAMAESTAEVNLGVEVHPGAWAPRRPAAGVAAPDVVVFVDGVRRVDARVWVRADDDPNGVGAEPGLCASWAAGAVRCEPGGARLGPVELGRGLFSASRHAAELVTPHGTYGACMARSAAPEVLSLALQERMGAAERVAAERAAGVDAALVVLDGPLRGRQHLPSVVGMVKTHHVAYLSGDALGVLAALAPGERTPAFTVGTSWTRHSWYVRLPGPPGAPLAGVVRCECPADVAPAALTTLADLTAVVLPRYASEAHKDARAPQNLYPIAGLERELRRRLGDPALLHRGLRMAAA